jgi:IS4 transposase
VLQTYRLRWQLELEFKRLKSLIQLGHLKKHDDQAALSWLQGKLLVSLLVARLIAHAERVSPWGYDIEQIV